MCIIILLKNKEVLRNYRSTFPLRFIASSPCVLQCADSCNTYLPCVLQKSDEKFAGSRRTGRQRKEEKQYKEKRREEKRRGGKILKVVVE